MVMIGYEAGTKAYHAYNPVDKKLIVTRDVLFEEEKSWNWSSVEPVKPISNEIFTVVYNNLHADDQDTGRDIDENMEDAPSPSAGMTSGVGKHGVLALHTRTRVHQALGQDRAIRCSGAP
jgi:hypothetical protein